MVFLQSANSAFNNVISGTGPLFIGTANLTLGGSNTYSGTTFIGGAGDGGTLTLTGDTSGLGGNILNYGTLVFNQAVDSSFAGLISRTGSLIKTGAGSLTLTGHNTYTGSTTIDGGMLIFTGDTTGLSGNIINNTAHIFNQDANSFFNPVISGAGSFTKSGAGNLTLRGANTYTGPTTIESGILTFTGDTSGLGGDILNNRALVFNQTINSSFGHAINGTGSLRKEGAGTLTLSGALTYAGATYIDKGAVIGALPTGTILKVTNSTYNLTAPQSIGSLEGNGNITLGAFPLTTGSNGASTFFSGVFSGTGELIKEGAGTFTVLGPVSCPTLVNDGDLEILAPSNTALAVTAPGDYTLPRNERVGSLVGDGNVLLHNFILATGGDNTSTTYSGVLSGTATGGLLKEGTGTFTLSGINTYGGFTTINDGTLIFTNDTSLLAGPLVNSAALVFDQSMDSSFGNIISGAGSFTKSGAGNLTLGGSNTYSGTTTVSSGTLTLTGDTSDLGGNILNETALVFDQAADSSFNPVISGAGTIIQSGAGNLTLGGSNTYSGTTTVSSGTLTFTGDTGGLGGNILNGTALVFDQAADSSFNPVISGAGTITKSGAGNLTLGGSNTYSGLTTVNGGALIFTGDTSGLGGNIVANDEIALIFGQETNSSFGGIISGTGSLAQTGSANLTLGGSNTYSGDTTVSSGTLTLTGDTSGLGGNILNEAALVFNQAANYSFAGIISGEGSFEKVGTGNLTLTGSNTYSGTTTVSNGTLTLAGDTGGLRGNILNNTALIFNQAADYSFAGLISGAGSFEKVGTGNLTLTGSNTYSGTTTVSNGTLTLAGDTSGLRGNIVANNETALIFDQGTNSSFGSIISGAGSFTKSGAGSLALSGNNTYSGLTTVNGGTLIFAGNIAGLSGNILNNAALVFNQAANSSFPGIISGTGSFEKVGTGSLTLTGANTYTGSTTIDDGTLIFEGNTTGLSGNILNNAALVFNQAANFSFPGIISGTGSFEKAGTGNLTLTGANTYTGSTTIDDGTLIFAGNTTGLSGNTLNNSALVFNQSVNSVFNNIIRGTGSLTQTGSANLTLGGSNTYSGTTTVSSGTLTFAGDTTGLGGNILNETALVFDQATDYSFGGMISGAGSFEKAGRGSLTLSGALTYTGSTFINNGALTASLPTGTTLQVTNPGAYNLIAPQSIGSLEGNGNITLGAFPLTTGSNDASTFFSGTFLGTGELIKEGTGTFTVLGPVSCPTLVNNGDLEILAPSNTALTVTAPGDYTLQYNDRVGSLAGDGNVLLNDFILVTGGDNTSTTYSGVLSGTATGGILKEGTGTFTLSGINTYGGFTTINDGTLIFTNDTSLLAGPLVNSAALVFDQSMNSSFGNIISGAGSFTKSGAGNLALSGNNTFTGPTAVNEGSLTFTGDTSDLGGNILNETALVFDQAADSFFNPVISGAGTITKSGAGNLTLGGSNTYSGTTTVSSGTLTFTGDTGGLEGNILNGTALVFDQAADSFFNPVISGVGTVTKSGAGDLMLRGGNTYNGLTTVNGGTLIFTGDTTGLGGNILNETALVFDQAIDSSFENIISGAGSFAKLGAGNLTLSGNNTFTGPTAVNEGSLIFTGDTSGLGGDILNNTALVFDQAADSSFPGIINGAGFFEKAGPGSLTLTGANTYTGPSTINEGIVKGSLPEFTALTVQALGGYELTKSQQVGSLAADGNVHLNNFMLTTGQNGSSTLFSGIISDTGIGSGLIKTGKGTFTLSGTSPYEGNTIVNQGTLSVNGTLPNSDVLVAMGAMLQGNGSMKSLNLAGTVSPGNSIGTLTMGTYIMHPSSTYLAEVSGIGASDLIVVTGNATLDGNLNVITDGSSRQSIKNKVYTILTAAGGANGKFRNLLSVATGEGLGRIKYTSQYFNNAVRITMGDLQDFADAFSPANHSNAARMARYLDTFADNALVGSDLSTIVQVLDGYLDTKNTSGLTAALNQLQPSLFREFGFLSFTQAALVSKEVRNQQQYRREGVWDKAQEVALKNVSSTRLASFRQLVENGTLTQSGPTKPKRKLGFIQDEGIIRGTPVAQRVRTELTSAWIQPYGQTNKKEHNSHGGATNGNVGLTSQTYGFSVGSDIQVFPNTFVGLLGGYSNTPFNWKNHRGKGHMRTGYIGLYGTWMDRCGLYVDAQVIGGRDSFHSKRNISFGPIQRIARGHHHAFQLSTDGEIGYALAFSDFTLQPFLNVDYIVVHENGYKERGAESLNLHIKSKTSRFLQGQLGATFYQTYVVDETLLRPAAQLGWIQKRPLGHGTNRIKGGLVNHPQTLTVVGDNRLRNQLAPAVSLTAQFPNGINVIANVSAAVFNGQNTGEALIKIGYDF